MIFCLNTKNGEQILGSNFGKFSIHKYYVYTTSFARFSRFHKFSKEKRFLLLTLARYRFHGCLIVNPKRELESKSPLQDINPMYITQDNPLCFNFICLLLKNNAAPILLARALLIVMVPNVYYFKG